MGPSFIYTIILSSICLLFYAIWLGVKEKVFNDYKLENYRTTFHNPKLENINLQKTIYLLAALSLPIAGAFAYTYSLIYDGETPSLNLTIFVVLLVGAGIPICLQLFYRRIDVTKYVFCPQCSSLFHKNEIVEEKVLKSSGSSYKGTETVNSPVYNLQGTTIGSFDQIISVTKFSSPAYTYHFCCKSCGFKWTKIMS